MAGAQYMFHGGWTGSISETEAQRASSSWEDQAPQGLHTDPWGLSQPLQSTTILMGGHAAANPLQPPSKLLHTVLPVDSLQQPPYDLFSTFLGLDFVICIMG